MKKKSLLSKKQLYDYEIDLVDIFIFVWKEKIKISLITFFSFLIAFTYNHQLPINVETSLSIKTSSDLEFSRLKYIYLSTDFDYHNQEKVNQVNQRVLNKFLLELMDYDEFILSINNEKIGKNSSVMINEKEKELFKQSKLLNINKINNNETILKLRWDNVDEAKSIFENTLKLTLKNLEELIFVEIEKNLEIKKKIAKRKDMEKIEYLSEQSSIAKYLDIVNNKEISFNNFDLSSSNKNYLIPYYLRGYKVIEKEIDIFKNRKYSNFKFLENEIALLKEFDINWIDYNINLLSTKKFKNGKLNLLISTLTGLIFALLYVIGINTLKTRMLRKG